MVGRDPDHRSRHPVLAEPGHRQQGVLAGVRAGGVPGQRAAYNHQPREPAADHLHPEPGLRVVLLHLQRAEPDHAAAPARLGQDLGDRAGGELRHHQRRRQRRVRLPGRPVEERRHVRHQSALAGRVRAVEAQVDGHRGQRADGPERGLRRTRQTEPQGVRRGPLHPGNRRGRTASGRRARRPPPPWMWATSP